MTLKTEGIRMARSSLYEWSRRRDPDPAAACGSACGSEGQAGGEAECRAGDQKESARPPPGFSGGGSAAEDRVRT